jgi:hypothetical protein
MRLTSTSVLEGRNQVSSAVAFAHRVVGDAAHGVDDAAAVVPQPVRELEGDEEQRIAGLAAESDLHARQIRTGLEFAARHPDDVEARIARNERAIAEGRRAARQRQALLA